MGTSIGSHKLTFDQRSYFSTCPAPSKNVQFISLGIRALHAESGHNELFRSRQPLVFALSSFGTIEDDDGNMDEVEATRRQSDNRYKNTVITPTGS